MANTKKNIRRQIDKNISNKPKIEEDDKLGKFIATLAGIILLLIVVYFVIGLFFTKEIDFKKDDDKKKTENVTIDNSTITAGQILSKNDENYYVLVYDKDSKLTNLSTFVSIYKGSEDHLPIYVVDSSNKINSKFIVKKNSNKTPTSYDDLRVKAPTLLKISNKSVVEYVENEEEIKNILNKK